MPAPAAARAFATPRLAIEPLAPAHADGLFAALDHPEIARRIGWPDVTTLPDLRAKIDRVLAGPPAGDPHISPDERWWNFAIRLRPTGTLIGRLEATTYRGWGEIAYVLGPPWWRQGLGAEATRWLIDHLTDHGFAELWAAVRPGNLASQRLLGRLGFTRSQPLRSLASYDGGDYTYVRTSVRPPDSVAR